MKTSATEIAQRADSLYSTREETENVRLSVELLEATLIDEFNYELAWRLGRALFFLGQQADDRAQARAFHARAVKTCEQAVRSCPSQVEGHFWLGVNLALLAALEKPLRALPHALRARRALRRAISLDAAYHAAGPLRVLARLESKLPRWLGGGHTRARATYEKAIQLAPANTVTRLYFAELLLETGDRESAHTQLQAILNAPHDPTWAFEIARDRRLAQEIIKKEKGERCKAKVRTKRSQL
ncbi:MAG: tetratricopeptide repeat protein [Pyrinomonadaceae bacterium]|nr:tetratricopeptide repeat protein [Pyrinomonadaceae bacterium]